MEGTETINPPLSILGMGNPLLDVVVSVPQSVLDNYELKLNNAILADERHKPLFDEIENGTFKVQYCAGGATLNSIRMCRGMHGKKVDAQLFMIGSVGSDIHGDSIKSLVKAEGVIPLFADQSTAPTGVCAVLVRGGERSLCTSLGAAQQYPIDHLRYKVWDNVTNADIVYSAGYFLTVCPQGMLLAAERCAKANKIFAFNLSATFLVEFFKEQMEAVIPYADYIFGNASEYIHFGKCFNFPDAEDLVKIAMRIAQMPKVNTPRHRVVVVTQGANPTIVVSSWVGPGVKASLLPPTAIERSKIIDTTGAGDAFVGGFLYGLSRGLDIDRCAFYGNWAGGYVVQRSGFQCDLSDIPNV